MVKIYKWSSILNYLIDYISDFYRANYTAFYNGSESELVEICINIISNYIDSNLQDDYYKYTSIVFIRSGSPIQNEVEPNNDKISPYNINRQLCADTNNISELWLFKSRIEKKLTEYYDKFNNIILFVLDNEYKLWCKIKKSFKDFDVNFVEFKNMYECDIEYYIKKKTNVIYSQSNYDNNDEQIYITSDTNSEYDSLSTFDYSISEIEKVI